MFAISPTDKIWFDYLKNSELNSYVNFWTPTQWNIKQLAAGDRLYFMLKSPIRKIGGFGEYVTYENLTPSQAWNKFGYRNGRSSRHEFIAGIQKYIAKNSLTFGGTEININTYKIGCITLTNCEFWDDDRLIIAATNNIDFPKQVVKLKYYDLHDPFRYDGDLAFPFSLVAEPRTGKTTSANAREGQGEFKGKILRAYSNRCCISGETIPELLEGAHIQGYKNRQSNHIQNGLSMRVDIHRLYDNGLLFIDQQYKIHVSSLVSSHEYRQYHGQSITLPRNIFEHPSKEALELRRFEYRGSF